MNGKPISYDVFIQRIRKETLYLYYEFEDAAIRSEPSDFYVKLKGYPEFKAKVGSGLVTEACLSPVEITKEDYDRF